jgi:hypothetical protein
VGPGCQRGKEKGNKKTAAWAAAGERLDGLLGRRAEKVSEAGLFFFLFLFQTLFKTTFQNSNSNQISFKIFTKFYNLFKSHTRNQKPCKAK